MNFQTTYQSGQLDRALAKSLPCLPGYSINFNVGADRFHKPGHFNYNQDVRVISDVEGWNPRKGIGKDVPEPRIRPGIGGCLPPPWAPVRTGPDNTIFPRSQGMSKLPTWLEFDKKVLAFDAYYQEPIPESGLESYRIHRCKIYFYLEDDTVQVIEPKTYNAGVPQGQVIRRHRIPLPEPCEGQYFTLEHFNVGCDITLYGKAFHVTGCDGFTRTFLNRLGISVPHNQEAPEDPGTEKLKDRKVSQFARKPHYCFDTRGPFLKHSGHVLRFWAYWDDRCKEYGDLRQFVFHYFLSDGTIEVQEILRPNSGYESYPMFLKRSKIPKKPENLVGLPGDHAPLTVLNVFGSMYPTKKKKAHWLLDNLSPGQDVEHYTDRDLAVGAVINIYGRPFVLTQCDEFTKQYYKEKYGVEEFTPLVLDEEVEREIPPRTPPPYHGWGQEDDLGMWKTLEVKQEVKDYRKQVSLSKDILRFEAKFDKALQRVNQSRRFVINYYMSDDTMQVFEKEHPNSGLPKGNFFYRSRIKKPGHQAEIGEDPDFYQFKDLFIGNIININGYNFQLMNADEFTLSYMESHKDLFPQSDICIALKKAKEAMAPIQGEQLLRCFAEKDTERQGVIDSKEFRFLLVEISKSALSEHEILTLTRGFAANPPLPGPDFGTIQSVAQTELRRNHFDRLLLARVEYTLRYHDPCRTGRIDRETLRATLKGAKMPIFKELLDFMVDKFPTADGDLCNQIDYCDFLKFLDWETNTAPIAKPAATQCVMNWVEPKPPLKIFCVNYRAFLDSVCPNIITGLPSVCCACPQPCTQHPSQASMAQEEQIDYCSKEQAMKNDEMQQCVPQEPVTVVLQPCSVTYTEGNEHQCAPGAKQCFANQENAKSEEGQAEPIPTFQCPPCGAPTNANY